jgi:hypothetical protein
LSTTLPVCGVVIIAYAKQRQHASAYATCVKIRQHTYDDVSVRQRTSAKQQTSVDLREARGVFVESRYHLSACVRIRAHSIRQHTSAYVRIRRIRYLREARDVVVESRYHSSLSFIFFGCSSLRVRVLQVRQAEARCMELVQLLVALD